MVRAGGAVVIFVWMFVIAAGTTNRSALDASQAKLMVSFLDSVRTGSDAVSIIEDLMASEGTELIVEQMNLARLVDAGQYHALLESFAAGERPDIAPLDRSERADRGVMGLERDVWRALEWGRENVGMLRDQLSSIARTDVYGRAKALAVSFLPVTEDFHPRLYLVAGGRAGAAALSDDRIYMDILVMTGSRAVGGGPELSETEVVEYFAHEMHHIGFAAYHNAHPNPRRDTTLIFAFLRGIVSEGAPTYLINAHRHSSELAGTLVLGNDEVAMKEGLVWTGEMVRKIIGNEFSSRDDYERANLLMLGLASHTLGAHMLNVIDRAAGLDGVMEVVAHPERLLLRFNDAARNMSGGSDFLFDQSSAEFAAALGDS